LNIDAACASMELTAPSESDNLTLSIETPPEDLNKLLYLSDFRSETYRVQQFAIWTITDNPERDGYVGIATGFKYMAPDQVMQKLKEFEFFLSWQG